MSHTKKLEKIAGKTRKTILGSTEYTYVYILIWHWGFDVTHSS